jgi:aminoglycoside 3-N-acetyltransferase
MWTLKQLVEDLKEIGLPARSAVLVHASLEAIGPIEGGAETLLAAFRAVLGPEGTLLIPTFASARAVVPDPNVLPEPERPFGSVGDILPQAKPNVMADSPHASAGFAAAVRDQPDAFHSDHPAFSFAAIGKEAEALTADVPMHYPLGSDGPLARLHQRNGWILLIGVGHAANSSLHLAEIWANTPYIHRTMPITTANGVETTMLGSPDCSRGFTKIESLLRQSRILRRAYIGNAESQLMRQQQTVSMAVAMLQGNPAVLLCDDESCRACIVARRMTAEQVVEPI